MALATGNDFVFGKASKYNLECFGSTKDITFDNTELPQPDIYGSRQMVTLQITIINQILLCSIYALDEVRFKVIKNRILNKMDAMGVVAPTDFQEYLFCTHKQILRKIDF